MSMPKPTRIAGAILVSKDGKLLLQRRDNNPSISSPDMISVFGGHVEGAETFLQCARREIAEETGLDLENHAFRFLVNVENTYANGSSVSGGFFVVEQVENDHLEVTEGRLIEIPLTEVHKFQKEMVPTTCFAVALYMQGKYA